MTDIKTHFPTNWHVLAPSHTRIQQKNNTGSAPKESGQNMATLPKNFYYRYTPRLSPPPLPPCFSALPHRLRTAFPRVQKAAPALSSICLRRQPALFSIYYFSITVKAINISTTRPTKLFSRKMQILAGILVIHARQHVSGMPDPKNAEFLKNGWNLWKYVKMHWKMWICIDDLKTRLPVDRIVPDPCQTSRHSKNIIGMRLPKRFTNQFKFDILPNTPSLYKTMC